MWEFKKNVLLLLYKLEFHSNTITCICDILCTSYVATGDCSGLVIITNVENGTKVHVF